MQNWYYYDKNGQKQGPIDSAQLKMLAVQGIITPETLVETDTGKCGKSENIKGIEFSRQTIPPILPPVPQSVDASTQPPLFVPVPQSDYCTYCGQPIHQAATACLSCGANPRVHKNFCGNCGVPINEVQVICTKCGTAVNGAMPPSASVPTSLAGTVNNISTYFGTKLPSISTPMSPAETVKKLNAHFTFFWVLMLVTMLFIPLIAWTSNAAQEALKKSEASSMSEFRNSLFSGVRPSFTTSESERQAAGATAVMSIFFTIVYLCTYVAAMVYWGLLIYTLWKLVPQDIARTTQGAIVEPTPGIAVGFSFIPIFSLYWQFVVLWGLGKNLNKTLKRQGLEQQVDEGLGLLACIVSCLTIISYTPYAVANMSLIILVTMVSIIAICLEILYMKSLKDGAIALLLWS